MTTRRDHLAAPFPDALVSWRPGAAIGAHKDACQKQQCRETRDGDKHMQFAYVEDEAVMDRLDEVLGLGGWQWKVEAVGEGVVRGALLVQWDPGADWVMYQDFGYAGNGPEPYKEAMTDAFRRCGRLVGIARYIYAGELEQAHRPMASRPAAPSAGAGVPAVAHAAVPAPAPSDGPEVTWDDLPEVAGAVLGAGPLAGDLCPVHAKPWRLVPAGVSKKTGRQYDAFFSCPERGCDVKPTPDWTARHAA